MEGVTREPSMGDGELRPGDGVAVPVGVKLDNLDGPLLRLDSMDMIGGLGANFEDDDEADVGPSVSAGTVFFEFGCSSSLAEVIKSSLSVSVSGSTTIGEL